MGFGILRAPALALRFVVGELRQVNEPNSATAIIQISLRTQLFLEGWVLTKAKKRNIESYDDVRAAIVRVLKNRRRHRLS